MYRHAWHVGLKTTYYLRTMQANNIEKSTVDAKKMEAAQGAAREKVYTEEEQRACSIDAMMNGGECESCQ